MDEEFIEQNPTHLKWHIKEVRQKIRNQKCDECDKLKNENAELKSKYEDINKKIKKILDEDQKNMADYDDDNDYEKEFQEADESEPEENNKDEASYPEENKSSRKRRTIDWRSRSKRPQTGLALGTGWTCPEQPVPGKHSCSQFFFKLDDIVSIRKKVQFNILIFIKYCT